MTIRAVLYDAKGHDREVDLLDDAVNVDKDRLLWLDIDGQPDDLARAGAAIASRARVSGASAGWTVGRASCACPTASS